MMYTVEVTREDDAWIADVVDLPGAHTFARNLTALDAAVREVIDLVIDAPADAEPANLRYVYQNVSDDFRSAAALGDERQEVEARQRALGVAAANHASKLAAAGYSVRDISGALRMSPGRVSQILNPPATRRAG